MKPERKSPSFDEILNHPYWRHRIPLDDGKYTPGRVDPHIWDKLHLPTRLDGMSFLDVGAFDGLLSFEAERRGASEILATDIWSTPVYDDKWWDNLRPGKQGFELAHEYLNSDVDSKEIPIQELDPETVGTFDIVVCSDVIHHLKEPYANIENLTSVTDQLLVVGTYTADVRVSGRTAPTMNFLKSDPEEGAWWRPNVSCVSEMLKATGCNSTEIKYSDRTIEKSLPDFETRQIAATEAKVYKTSQLSDQIDTIASGGDVHLLYQREDTVRIEYRTTQEWGNSKGEHLRQGWIRSKVVNSETTDDNQLGLKNSLNRAKRLANFVYNDGVDRAMGETKFYIQGKATSGVVHAEFD